MKPTTIFFFIFFSQAIQTCYNDQQLSQINSFSSFCSPLTFGFSDMGREIGNGATSKVYALKNQPNKVAKVINFSKSDSEKSAIFLKEVNSLKCVSKDEIEGVLKMDSCQFGSHGAESRLVIFMDQMHNLDLEKLFQSEHSLLKDDIWRINTMYKLLRSLKTIASIGMIIRDIKPANIMFKTDSLNDPMFIDLGFSIMATSSTIPVGSDGYSAPEVTAIQSYEPGKIDKATGRKIQVVAYDNKIDVFSLGLVFFKLWNSKHNPMSRDKYQNFVETSLPDTIPREINELIQRMVKVKKEDRCTSEEAYQYLKTYVQKMITAQKAKKIQI